MTVALIPNRSQRPRRGPRASGEPHTPNVPRLLPEFSPPGPSHPLLFLAGARLPHTAAALLRPRSFLSPFLLPPPPSPDSHRPSAHAPLLPCAPVPAVAPAPPSRILALLAETLITTPSPPSSSPRRMKLKSSAQRASSRKRRHANAAKTLTACSGTPRRPVAGKRPSRSSSLARVRAARARPSNVSTHSLPTRFLCPRLVAIPPHPTPREPPPGILRHVRCVFQGTVCPHTRTGGVLYKVPADGSHCLRSLGTPEVSAPACGMIR